VRDPHVVEHVETTMRTYLASLQDDRRVLLHRYIYVDFARKVVGVGSVGTRCDIALLRGNEDDDPLFLQIKEASSSVLERYVGRSVYRNHGQRVVRGQQLMQAASDICLGWGRLETIHYYLRQLRDMKGTVDLSALTPGQRVAYAELCGWALARAHARSGDAARISGYLGNGDAFDRAIVAFAQSYADQTERDHAALATAVKEGRVVVEGS
jgi:uncharacterized protein (DUF2252 family)